MTSHRRGSFHLGLLALLASVLSGACGHDGSSSSSSSSSGTSPSSTSTSTTTAPTVTPAPTANPTPTLHAWADPIGGTANLADHTWVTSFDPVSQCPPGQSYWYAWGGCHQTGSGATSRSLGTHAADMAVANCICTPDVHELLPPNSASHGGINLYGIDGVCHQLSNRILWATTKGTGDSLTVDGAKGYGASRWLFGTYGANVGEWQNRIARCTAAAAAPTAAPGTPVAMAMHAAAAPKSLDPDLDAMIREKLGPEFSREKAARIRDIRARVLSAKKLLDRRVRSGQMSGAAFAESVNDLVDRGLRETATVLTPEEYRKLFGVAPGEKIGVVDPKIAEQSGYNPG